MSGRRRIGGWIAIAIGIGLAIWAGSAQGAILNLREGATDPATAERLREVNQQWERQNPGQVPCRKCEFRPAGSNLVWTYYRRQGFFPNWVSAARDLRRREREGETDTFRAGVDEIVSYSSKFTSSDGLVFRTNESPYLSTDSTAPPWRDAMGHALILTLFIPAIPSEPTPEQLDEAITLSTEYLNAFEVNWKDNGIAAETTAGGRWYLEYATKRGDRARVLNGFMQSLKSLDVFATQAEALSADPRFAALRDRAREYVIAGSRELYAQIDKYDFGRDKLSKYSLIDPNPAPPIYQTFHRQLLLWIRDVPYLPLEWRDKFELVRLQWGGKEIGGFNWFSWWMITLMSLAALLVLLGLRRLHVLRRSRTRVRPRGPGLGQA